MSPDPADIDLAVALAARLQQRAEGLQTAAERRQQLELDRMCQTPEDKATLVQLTDQAFRSKQNARIAGQFTHILDVQGIPRFFSPLDRAMLRGFQTFGNWLPGVTVPLVREHMRHETANVVLPAEPEHLTTHLKARQAEGVRMNLNFLGEALLGEDEATHRLDKYLAALQMPDVEVLSVKISTLYSQISALAREHTLNILCARLEMLYRTAGHLRFTRKDGTNVPKFVYLDMEEYRDLHLTAAAFMRTLDRPGLHDVSAGIALQAYIPDSAQVQRQINEWARKRVAAGGAPVTIRLVKGANMEMERVEAAQRGWPQAPFKTKLETDANYKRILDEAMRPANLAAVRIGVASHNLFDLAYALVRTSRCGTPEHVQFEMLEGMANPQRRALLEETQHLLLYAPACRREDFLHAIGYLIRRLDENTGPDNFLRHSFKLKVGSEDWQRLEAGFRAAFALQVQDSPRRTQDRLTEDLGEPRPEFTTTRFENEPDTDWSLPRNSQWAQQIVRQESAGIEMIPLVVAGKEVTAGHRQMRECRDPSRPGVVVTQYVEADHEDVTNAVSSADLDADGWRSMTIDQRNTILGQVAAELRQARGTLMWAALANGGKTLAESDPEVSEAVDFVEFYRASAREHFEMPEVTASGCGVVVVVPPWNFPIAIPCGGMAAALAAGNTVILKPASDTVLVAWELCQCFWRGGVPRTALQFLPCPGGGAGAALAAHPAVDAVILTGGTETARRMLAARPEMRLFAETGGKNASTITALSDRELALKHVIHSAFSHSGQKCSATSLLLLEREVYEDADFKRMLVDAVKSLPVGSAWELSTRLGPLIRPPSGELEAALKRLEPGESWAVMPCQAADNPALWSPGVKWDVQRGSVTHLTEFFGPVLAVMPFDSLAEAVEIVNETGYGLTSGLHSLDEREIEQWRAGIQAGNLYVNRSTVGAVVLRQPFGGLAKSSFGPGMKAGGPHYVAQFVRFEDRPAPEGRGPSSHDSLVRCLREAGGLIPPQECKRLLASMESCERAWAEVFSLEHDVLRLPGQDNLRRYLPLAEIRVRVTPRDTPFEIIARAAAARQTGARVILSTPPGLDNPVVPWLDEATHEWAAGIEFVEETDEALAAHLQATPPHAPDRIRFAAPDRVPDLVRQAAVKAGQWLADDPVLVEGRIELLRYLREQSLSHDYHRYGNLGARSEETRSEPA